MYQNKKLTDVKSISKKRKYDGGTSVIKKLKYDVSLLKKAVERKALTYQYSTSQVDATSASIASLGANITQGSTASNRIGNKVSLKSIQYNIWCYNGGATTSGQGAVDILLDRNPTGTLPAITDIYSDGDPTRLIYWGYKSRFKSLVHHHFTYDATSLSAEGKVFQGYKKISYDMQFNGSAGTIADLAKGQNDILIVYRSSNTSAGGLSYGTVSNYRLIFTDS